MSAPRVQIRLIAGFVALLAVMATLGAVAISVMGTLRDETLGVSNEAVPEILAAGRIDAGVNAVRQPHFRHVLADSPSDRVALESQVAAREADVSALLAAHQGTGSDDVDLSAVERARESWARYTRQTRSALTLSRADRDREAEARLLGPAELSFGRFEDALHEWQSIEGEEAAHAAAVVESSSGSGRTVVLALVVAAVIGVAVFALWSLLLRPLRRVSRVERFDGRMRRALEMIDTEDGALRVVGSALSTAAPKMAGELLLADSSQAHLNRAVAVGNEGRGPGCPVESPHACAAVRRGQTTVFPSSEAIDACPYLKDRPTGPCSAVCVPVTVLGRTIGVLHATGSDGRPPPSDTAVRLETIATQGGSRLGVIRAMSDSQLQASTDPLTGLVNRRVLERAVKGLRNAGQQYAVAMVDVDRFKVLNDTFGHETGDRALRLLARAMQDAVREEDIVCRYGGEEFAILFPRCSAGQAAEIVARVQRSVAEATAAGDGPVFTASFGLADTTSDAHFEGILRAADAALLQAKRDGRDRLVLANGAVLLAPEPPVSTS